MKRFIIVALCFLAVSCMDSSNDAFDSEEQYRKDVAAIDNFLLSNNISAIKDPSGIRMQVISLGSGLPAAFPNSSVDVDYTGKLFSNGSVFDQGNVRGVLSDYIPGWQIALTTLPEGSSAVVYIPSYFGYGNKAQGSIPANSILVFEINFNEVVKTSQELQKLASDTVAIDEYLESKNIEAIKDPTGIRYVVTTQGEGPTPLLYSRIKIKYSFKLLTDDSKTVATLEQEPSDEFYSRVVDYIHGMKIALLKLPEGSSATLYVPSGLGFGTQNATQNNQIIIPANSNLIVEVELIEVR